MAEISGLQSDIEQRLSTADPKLEVILVERLGSGPNALVRVYVDHPDGVDHGVCRKVAGQLQDLLTEYSLEVSSPGIDRPLTKPEHFRRYQGSKAKVETVELIDGRKRFKGSIAATSDEGIDLECEGESYKIAFEQIKKSNLLADDIKVGR